MTYSYYPGCTLKTQAKQLDISARACAKACGIELQEIPNWQCCGGVTAASGDEVAGKLAAVRALAAARDAGQEMVTLCSACFHVLRRVNIQLRENEEFAARVNQYLQLETPYTGETPVWHFLQVLRDQVGWEALKNRVVHPLTGQKIAPYYGCLMLRPAREMMLDDPENPQLFEQLLSALGATPVITSQRNECCGGCQVVTDPAKALAQSRTIVSQAEEFGAQALMTACPLCQYNLLRAGDTPVLYFTEFLAKALGVEEKDA